MAVGIKDASTVSGGATVDSSFKALRVAPLPITPAAAYRAGVRSGSATAVAANGAVFSLRNTANVPIVIKRVGVGFITTTAFTAAQEVAFGLYVARSWSTADSGGTAVTLTGNTNKKRTTLNNPTGLEVRIASTAALTAGTRTLDTYALSTVGAWSGAAGAGVGPAIDNLWDMTSEDYPIVIGQNEGIVINNLVLMGAAGVGVISVNVGFDEYVTY